MSSIVAALLSGFLNAKQIASLALVCMAKYVEPTDTTPEGVTLTCVLVSGGDDISVISTPPLLVTEPVPVPALAEAWCEVGRAAVIPATGPAS